MLRVLIGIQANAETEATNFMMLKTESSDINSPLTEIESKAITGKEWSEEGIASIGQISGSVTAEVTRKTLETLLEVGGFDKDNSGEDSILNAPEAATYKYATIIQEFTDDTGASHYDKYVGCIINSLSINLAADTYVKATITPVSVAKANTTSGKFSGTIAADAEESLFCEKTVASIGGSAKEAELTTFNIELNNSLSTEKSISGGYILQKGERREVKISTSRPRLLSAEYLAEYNKAKLGTGIAASISLKNVDNEEVSITIPKIVYSELSRSNLNKNGSLNSSLKAKWDDTTSKVIDFTFKGLGTA